MTKRNLAREGQMAALYAEGKTLQNIGDQFGITRERVRQILARLGVQRRTRGVAKNSG